MFHERRENLSGDSSSESIEIARNVRKETFSFVEVLR